MASVLLTSVLGFFVGCTLCLNCQMWFASRRHIVFLGRNVACGFQPQACFLLYLLVPIIRVVVLFFIAPT